MRLQRKPGGTGFDPRSGSGPAGDSRFPCFDGLRAIAALLVIGVHTAFTSGFGSRAGLARYTSRLEIGVEVFFVISGFLLYRPFAVAHFGGRAAPTNRVFWTRRLRRIVPAYWTAFVVITYVMKADTVRHTWDAPLIYLGFAQIYFPHYVLTGLTQAWSLCTEMTFYLVVPLYASLLGRADRPPDRQYRAELSGLVSLVAVGLAYRIPVLSSHSHLAETMPNWLPGYIDQFALGMFLAVTSAWLVAVGRRPSWLWHPTLPWACWALAGLAFVAVSNIGLPVTPVTASPVGASLLRQALYGAFGFFMVVPAVFGPQDRGLVRGLLTLRPLALVGVVSYGVYLWHEAWINKYFTWTGDRLFSVAYPNMLVMVAGLAVASASASYLLIERPILRRRRLLARPGEPGAVSRPPRTVGRSPVGTAK
jgi:peptidoglycan/LPS O-acetylase OafA/YrhL